MAPPVNFPLSLLRLQPLPCRGLRLRPILASSSSSSSQNDRISKARTLYPRDIRIEIGRYKGRMLGTLPSSYLKWLSKPVDPGSPLSYWSQLANLVLQDPVYQDRVEWEPAHRLFTGEGLKGTFFQNESFDVMKAYREIGERFGWDMDDEEAWSRVNRDHIGTSFSGRIPRKKEDRGEKGEIKKKRGELNGVDNGKKGGFLVGKKRGQRMERMRLRRERNKQMVESEVVVEEEISEEKKEAALRIRTRKERVSGRKGDLGRRRRELGVGINDEMISVSKREEKSGNVEIFNPFPGRDALFHRIRGRKD